MKETNMKEIKKVCLFLLSLPYEETEIPSFLIHPFITSTIYPVDTDGEKQFVNILESEENYQRVVNIYTEMINNAKGIPNLYVFLHKPYRTVFFKLANKYMSEEDYNTYLADAWYATENPNQDVNVSLPEWKEMFKKANKELLMEDDEYEIYKNLPENDLITLYRGVGVNRNPDGFSWTDKYETAKWFAERWGKTVKDGIFILKGQCYKKNILAYFDVRSESEYVIDPHDMINIERINL